MPFGLLLISQTAQSLLKLENSYLYVLHRMRFLAQNFD